MSQEKTAEIIDLGASRAAAGGEGAGPFLESARRAAGLSVGDVAAATKIKPQHVEAIEAGNASALPATPYAVGFVKVYAAYLDLDAEAIAAEFKKELMAARPAPEPEPKAAGIPAYDASVGVKFASLLGILLIAAFAIWIGLQIAGGRGADEAVATQPASRIHVSERRAEAPKPRALAARDYEVTPIPPVGGAAPAEEPVVENEAAPLVASLGLPNAPDTENVAGAPETTASEPPPALANDEAAIASANDALPAPPARAEETQAPSAADALTAAQSLPPLPAPTPLAQEPLPRRPAAAPAEPEPAITAARLIRSIGPVYPRRCERSAEALESVSLVFDVNANGRTTNPRVVSSTNSCFEDAAVAAIAKWRFDPRTVGGAPRPQTGVQATLNFRR